MTDIETHLEERYEQVQKQLEELAPLESEQDILKDQFLEGRKEEILELQRELDRGRSQ